jgi:succinoglycan biosynthesis protein ExoL
VTSMFGRADIPIVYECLDIHRLVLRDDPVGRALRAAEARLARDGKLLITSSPAFLRNYFDRFGHVRLPVELVENKYLELDPVAEQAALPPGPPWRIGWFGTLRCRRSLHMLGLVAETLDGRFEVDLRGRPALDAMPDFHEKVARTKNIAFHGAYRNPEDIGGIYGQVHFSWVIDFYEEGQNSEWLLPNRLYEGCRFGAVPVAMKGTETARFIERHGIGIVLDAPTDEALLRAFSDLTADRVAALRRNVAALPRSLWSHDRADCTALAARLAGLADVPELAADGSGDALKVTG